MTDHLLLSAAVRIIPLSLRGRKRSSAEGAVESLLHPILKAGRVEHMTAGSHHQRHMPFLFFKHLSVSDILIAGMAGIALVYFGFLLVRVLSEWYCTNGAGLLEGISIDIFLEIVEVVRNQLFGDEESGTEISLKSNESEQNDVDADEGEQKFGTVLQASQFLHIEPVVYERNSRDSNRQNQLDSHPASASLGVGKTDLNSKQDESLVYPEDEAVAVVVGQDEVDGQIEAEEKSLLDSIELVPDYILVVPHEEQAEGNVDQCTQRNHPHISIQHYKTLPEQDHVCHHYKGYHLHYHPL